MRPSTLANGKIAASPSNSTYKLSQSPSLRQRHSFESEEHLCRNVYGAAATADIESIPQCKQPSFPPRQPSLRLLFSFISQRDFCFFLLPAFFTSVIAGGIAPFMTLVVGKAFDAFAKFPLAPDPPQSAQSNLLRNVGLASIELVGLALGTLFLSSITSALWISAGERNVMRLRKNVYEAVAWRKMEWFDTKMGTEYSAVGVEGEGHDGAGGLMASFSRETDDVRMASSLAFGLLVQSLTTCTTCLALAFIQSWALTFVILSAVPLFILVQYFSQKAVGPILASERAQTAKAATLVERALAAIATVKAFNAVEDEHDSFSSVLDRTAKSARKVNAIWSVTFSLSQFLTMSMFVQAFWFGAKLVREHKISPGAVMTVFWACLISMSNLQMCIPQFIILTRGKWAMVALATLIDQPPMPSVSSQLPFAKQSRISLQRKVFKCPPRQLLHKIRPTRCAGEFSLDNVSFSYPSRPTVPVLSDVTLFLPARETTFVVGGSGSGKSTIAQLLARMYDPQAGVVRLDNQDVAYLDEEWTRRHVAVVSQSCIMFDMSVHDNVAIGIAGSGTGRRPEDVTRGEVVDACTAALMHEFVRDLPDGYDTRLGTDGANLSGGQKQRLAIARAKLRDPTVLILDEATSALDVTSRLLVFDAIRVWRKNMTTIVITHDLSQISACDFVYVLKGGRVVEQGYRHDLEVVKGGEFRQMMLSRGETGNLLRDAYAKVIPENKQQTDAIPYLTYAKKHEKLEDSSSLFLPRRKQQSIGAHSPEVVRHSRWTFDARSALPTSTSTVPVGRNTEKLGDLIFNKGIVKRFSSFQTRLPFNIPTIDFPSASYPARDHRLSSLFEPLSLTVSMHRASTVTIAKAEAFNLEMAVMEQSGNQANRRRLNGSMSDKRVRVRWDETNLTELNAVKFDKPSASISPSQASCVSDAMAPTSFSHMIRDIYPTVPHKPLILFGIFLSVMSGVMTPIFSFLLSRLLFEVSIGAQDVVTINRFGGVVLSIAAADGLLMGLKFFTMETAAMNWVTSIRKQCYAVILAQDKKWFDKSENSPIRMVQVLIKDGDDSRSLISVVLGQFVVVASMLSVGFIWALVRGWQIALAGFAVAPVFGIVMSVQADLIARCERRNKAAREEVGKVYYESISNIRAIRSMSLESVFQRQFEDVVSQAYRAGLKGAFVEGCTYGIASALIYLTEALLFYVGAVLIARGTYTYLQMVEALNLVVFSVSIGSQHLSFTQRIAKATQATRDFNKVLMLSTDTDESRGSLKPMIMGDVKFKDVSFSYPERKDVTVLQRTSLRLAHGESVAIVGSSGSGKSTVASLLQRLYEPSSGTISIGTSDLAAIDIRHLRHHISVVSQNPNFFDATISENIAYGSKSMSMANIHRAAKSARVHDFIMALPKGYDTMVGDNASLISGGQAQRLQIARALARPSRILILDECTSALDPANQAAVIEAVRSASVGRTTLVITHQLPMMKMCDRIVVLHESVVAEEGSYDELIQCNGVFSQLASGGEWAGE